MNNAIVLNNVNTNLFKKDIVNNFVNNLMKSTCSTIANMLAIDYTLRLNSKPEAEKYINKCISRLKSYLGMRVINDDNFSVALELFAIMITSEDENEQNKNNILEQSQDIIAENLVEVYFGDEINSTEKEKIKNIFKTLLKEKNFDKIINYAESHKKLFKASVMYAMKKYNNIDEATIYIKKEFNKILEMSLVLTQKSNIFKQATGKIAGAVCALLVGAISVATAGAAFSIIVVPASIFAVRYAPELGEKIGGLILNNDNAIKLEQSNIDKFMKTLQNDKESLLSQEKTKNIKQNIKVSPSQINAKLTKKVVNEKHR
ncbi:RP853 family protein [Rickettsia fournieri]|uniref:RP853 family protein n=1 Tax=Rickettsia fournieri TaxID=1436798 RepID=UPI000CDED5DA|nr:RP853 family protein [Rickettsia fournieri]